MQTLPNVYEVHQFMNDKNIVFAYTGTFDHFVTTSLLKSIRRKLKTFHGPRSLNKRNYSVLVESIENVSKHCMETDKDSIGMLLLCEEGSQYIIITGNHISNKDIPALTEKLERMSKLDQADLKKMYRNQILSEHTNDNNAGLGLLDILIKSGNKIKYEFQPRTEDSSFYLFQAAINIY